MDYKDGHEGETCVVDKVALFTSRDGNRNVKFVVRHHRRPEVSLFLDSNSFFTVASLCINFLDFC